MQDDKNLLPEELYILDTETASLQGGVVELAYLKVDQELEIRSEFLTLVDPQRPIDPGAQAIHGITDEMVAGKPTLAQVAAHFDGPIVMVGHNAQFDRRMIQPEIQVRHIVCTLQIARKTLGKDVSNHKLETLQAELSLPEQKSHSALGDVHTCRDFLLWLRDHKSLDFKTLLQRSLVPQVVHEMPFGKHKGKPLTKLPPDYRAWLLTQQLDNNLRFSLERLSSL